MNSYTFGSLSTIAFVLRETTGTNLENPSQGDWHDNPNFTAVRSFTPF